MRHAELIRQHFLSCNTWCKDVSRHLVLQRFEVPGHRDVKIPPCSSSIVPRALSRRSPDDVSSAEQRNGKQTTVRVVGILNEVKRLFTVELFEFAKSLSAVVKPV